MAKKKYILSESAVRRFQKLALVKPINEFGMSPAYNREEEMYEQDDDEDVEDVDMAPPDAPMGDVGAEEMARTVIQAVADALGVDIDIEGAEGGEELPGEELPGEELPGEEFPGEEFPGDEVEEDEVIDEVNVIDEEELTEAVMKRVVKRLKGMAAKSRRKKA